MGSEQKIDNCKTCRWIGEKKEIALAADFGDTALLSLKKAEIEHINRFHFGEKKR